MSLSGAPTYSCTTASGFSESSTQACCVDNFTYSVSAHSPSRHCASAAEHLKSSEGCQKHERRSSNNEAPGGALD
jgi:hypothetical protein